MSTKRSLILQKVQLLHNCTSVYIIVPMLTYKKIHFVYKKDTALVCHPLPFCKIWRRHGLTVLWYIWWPTDKVVPKIALFISLTEHLVAH